MLELIQKGARSNVCQFFFQFEGYFKEELDLLTAQADGGWSRHCFAFFWGSKESENEYTVTLVLTVLALRLIECSSVECDWP